MVRTDGAGASHDYLDYLHRQRVSYSIGFAMTDALAAALDEAPIALWTALSTPTEMPVRVRG